RSTGSCASGRAAWWWPPTPASWDGGRSPGSARPDRWTRWSRTRRPLRRRCAPSRRRDCGSSWCEGRVAVAGASRAGPGAARKPTLGRGRHTRRAREAATGATTAGADGTRGERAGEGPGGAGGPRYVPIADHGLIGDLRTAALVAVDGTIDWYCCPAFDAPSVFASLLDADRGGCFELAAAVPARKKQFYFPDTNVLITRFYTEDGVGEVQDFMPVSQDPAESSRHRLIRRVLCVRGTALRLRHPVAHPAQGRGGDGVRVRAAVPRAQRDRPADLGRGGRHGPVRAHRGRDGGARPGPPRGGRGPAGVCAHRGGGPLR